MTYRVGLAPDGKDVEVNDLDEFWEVASNKSQNGYRFSKDSYNMIVFDDLPYEVREKLRYAKRNYVPADILESIGNRGHDVILDFIEEIERE